MKYIITESQLKLLTEQLKDSSVQCDKNISKSAGYLDVWRNMDEKRRNELVGSIKNTINQSIEKSRQEYIKWFKNPLTMKKFKTPQEQDVLKKLPTFLNGVFKVNLSFEGPKSSKNARAWTKNTEPNVINYNLSQLHNGNDFEGQSIDYTTKHEMGHLIDYFFRKNGIETYLQTISTETQDAYQNNYLINDRDQYTRLNVLRGIIGAGPADAPETLLSKFLSGVKSGKISSDRFTFKGATSTLPGLVEKNDLETARKIDDYLRDGISVDGRPNLNLQQLFSNFGILKGNIVFVSFELLGHLNVTSKDLEKKYYLLKISPK